MNILAFDWETTGIPNWDLPADDPSQPYAVELGAVLCDDAGKELFRYRSIVKPDGWEISEHVAKIHGITTEVATSEGKPIAEVLDALDKLLAQAGLLIAFNLRFDDKIARSMRRRLGRPDGFGTIPVFCCMRGATPLCKLERKSKPRGHDQGKYKTPKLTEAVKILLGREHVGAHGALADALATKDIYFACRDNHEFMAAGSAFKTNEAKATVPKEPPAVADASPRTEISSGAVKAGPPQVGFTMDDLFNLYNNGDKAQ